MDCRTKLYFRMASIIKNIHWYIIALVVLVVVTKKCEDASSKKFRQEIESRNKKIDSLKVSNDSIKVILDSLKKQVEKQEKVSENLRYQIYLNKNKRDEVLNNVRDYDEWQLDSILTNHRHIERTKN